ncbi:MAG: DUF4062 domain-containing protein [Acidobacteriota bacterium]|jgi:hypothetical protein|nr:DUF4062 domain-containing protein [Acidobacteriota bacterium]
MNLVFVSSPQVEFAHMRKELCYFVLTDPYLKQFFDVFLFENLPANQRNPQRNYRKKVKECDIYLGLFGKTYGTMDGEGLSATQREFDYATELGKDRIVFIRALPPRARQARKMAALITRAKLEVTFDTFGSLEELKRKVMQSLLYWQQDQNRRPLP